jgi:hypothetical protein
VIILDELPEKGIGAALGEVSLVWITCSIVGDVAPEKLDEGLGD